MSENENKQRLLSIGQRVKAKREKMGLTQEEFADRYGYPRSTLAKLEAGLRDFKSTEILKLASELDVSCDYLLGRTLAAAPDEFTQKIVDQYGLDEQTLSVLEGLKKSYNSDKLSRDPSEIINFLLTNVSFHDFLRELEKFGAREEDAAAAKVSFDKALSLIKLQNDNEQNELAHYLELTAMNLNAKTVGDVCLYNIARIIDAIAHEWTKKREVIIVGKHNETDK